MPQKLTRRLVPVLVALLTGLHPLDAASPPHYDVRDFGARGDGQTLNTTQIQQAIDTCAQAGGGEVLITGGSFVTGTLFLRDNIVLRLAAGAALLGSTNLADYATNTHKNIYDQEAFMDRCLIFARGATNLGLVGQGVIDGRGQTNHFPRRPDRQRPMLIRFLECSNIRVRDVSLRNPAAWTSAWLYCRDIVVDGVTIQSRANANGDGLDFDGCQDVRVSNCSFDTSDDSICLQGSRPDRPCRNIVINNCVMSSRHAAIRIGLSSLADFEDVTVSNCVFRDLQDCGLKIQVCEGGAMRNMLFANLVMHNVPRPVFITFNAWRMGVDTPTNLPPMRELRDLQFSNLRVDNSGLTNAACAFIVSGIPGHPIKNLVFSGISFTGPGGGREQQAAIRTLPEFTGRRPEFGVLGRAIPFAGFYARHVRGLKLDAMRFETVLEDARPVVVCDDVSDLDLAGLRVGANLNGASVIHLRDVQDAIVRDCRSEARAAAFVELDGSHTSGIRVTESNVHQGVKLRRGVP